jgi:Mor family transcriptional regulator
MNLPERYPEHLKTVANVIAEALERDGVDPSRAGEIAFAATERLRFEHGGDAPYIPKGHLYESSVQWDEIFAAWSSGTPMAELLDRYDITPRHMRRIIDHGRTKRVKRDQYALDV